MTFQRNNTRGSKLTGEQVIEIRERYATERGCTQPKLSQQYGVSIGTIANIVNGLTWQHLLRGQEPQVNRPPWAAPMAELPSEEEVNRRLSERLDKIAEMPRKPFAYARGTEIKVPSLYEDPPPKDIEPTGAGLDKLNKLAAQQPRVQDELDKLDKGD